MALVNVNGLVTRYKVVGKGKPLILLHGWGGSSESFLGLQKVLAGHYKTIALDLPGFGQTDYPQKAWGIADYADFVFAFTKKIELSSFYLLGHSFGGHISMLLSAKYPKAVKKLVLVASAGICHQPSFTQKGVGMVAHVGKRIMSLPLLNKLEYPVKSTFYKLIRRQDYYLASGIMKDTIKRVLKENVEAYLNDIRVYTLIIWGDKDNITPIEDAHVLERRIKRAELRVIRGGTHYVVRRDYRAIASYVKQFIS
jgi:pimeloyl-ACP methyl ester carboxylesterase